MKKIGVVPTKTKNNTYENKIYKRINLKMIYVILLHEAILFTGIPNKHSINQIKYTSVKLKSDTYMENGQLIRIRIVQTYIQNICDSHTTYMRCIFIRNVFISLSKCIWTYKTKTFLVKM